MKLETLKERAATLRDRVEALRLAAYDAEVDSAEARRFDSARVWELVEGQLNDAVNALAETVEIIRKARTR